MSVDLSSSKWVGCVIKKEFAEGIYTGKVTSVEREIGTKKLLCHVVYSDGDMEDLYLEQLKQYLVVPINDGESTAEWTKGWGECNDSRTTFVPQLWERFPCQIEGAKRASWRKYPGGKNYRQSYLYCLQRLSERNYAMRALVYSTKDSVGARFTTWKHARFRKRAVSWLPPTTMRDHITNRNIVDTFHADLVRPKDGESYLTPVNLLRATNEDTECLFVNSLKCGSAAVATCIRKAKKSYVSLSYSMNYHAQQQ